MEIVGRQKEIDLLKSLLEQDEASFVAVHGRIGVGKTYLVRQVCHLRLGSFMDN